MKILYKTIFLIIFSTTISCSLYYEVYDKYNDCKNTSNYKTITFFLEGENLNFPVRTYIGKNQKEYQEGLMCRRNLPDNIDGMLFEYKTGQLKGFWMYKTYIPLNVIYFDKNKNSIQMVNMNKCTRKLFESQNNHQNRCLEESYSYNPTVPYFYVLELKNNFKHIDEITSYLEYEKLKLRIKN